MLMCLLKRVLPFTLTFIVGAALGGFFNPFGAWRGTRSVVQRTELHDYGLGKSRGCKHRRFKRRELVAETKPLVILFKPDARYPRVFEGYRNSVWVRVTFGADSKVQKVEQLQPLLPNEALEAVERAARQIQFEPETINGLPVSVTKEIEIRFMVTD